MFLCFAVFIVACGTTHLMEIYNIWYPTYWLSGVVKAITAVTSVVTAILLVRLVPKALALRGPGEWKKITGELQQELEDRKIATARIAALNEELRMQAAKLESANKELETFAYSVSHDLRAPLRHIDGYVDLLRTDCPDLPANGNRYLNTIRDSTRRLGVLIDNLLAFSRMGRSSMNPAWVDTNEVVASVREELDADVKNRQIEWQNRPAPPRLRRRDALSPSLDEPAGQRRQVTPASASTPSSPLAARRKGTITSSPWRTMAPVLTWSTWTSFSAFFRGSTLRRSSRALASALLMYVASSRATAAVLGQSAK